MRAVEFWRTLATALAGGERVFLTLVAENTRHSPGTVGARLLLSSSGHTYGTVGGGIMEHRLLERGAEILRRTETPAPEIETLHHRQETTGQPSGMICAGRQTNLSLVCGPEDLEAVRQIVAWLDADLPGCLRIDPGGLAVAEQAPDLTQQPIVLQREEQAWHYREALLNRRRVAILGGGHCGAALARVMHWLGYEVFIFETREDVIGDELRQQTRAIHLVDDFRLAGVQIPYPELTQAVVMTPNFPSDVRALAGLLGRPFAFVGIMGAPAKLRRILSCLRDEGFTDADLEQVRGPVGLPIGSNTPEEIAISVAAQLLKLRGEERALELSAEPIWF